MKFFGQLFDAPAEIVIAHGRVVLAAFSLAAITIDPTEPPQLSLYVGATLSLYAAYAVALLGALHWRLLHNPNAWLIHSIDLAVLALLLFLTEGLTSPFLVFFTFVLLAASLRWDWQSIAVTMVVLVMIAGLFTVASYGGPNLNVGQAVIRGAYLVAIGTVLAYASAHREHERNRLAALARWPAAAPGRDESGPFAATLKQVASVLEAERALVVWDEANETKAAIWQEGRCQIVDAMPDSAIVLPRELESVTFSRTLPDLDRINLPNGSVRAVRGVLNEELVSRFGIADFSSAPFRGVAARGRLFILGNIRPSDDHLPLTSVVADRVGAELDRQIFLENATRAAAMRERSVIMRDLHDSLLQSLTAARTQLELELLPAKGEEGAKLRTILKLLQNEQRRVRQFVDNAHATDSELVPIDMLRPLAENAAQLWGCAISVVANPTTATVSRKILNQLSLMLAEVVANAVRHGGASHVDVALTSRGGRLEVELRDDGHGFVGIATNGEPIKLPDDYHPKSLSARLKELGGKLSVHTSRSGSVLRLELST
jgi:signal transduction histidine kinase